MTFQTDSARAVWTSPSNIALVKYWGKKANQIPANPSISFTLDQACSHTEVTATYLPQNPGFDFVFEGRSNAAFEPKLQSFLDKASEEFTWLKAYRLHISSSNTFPHSSGIASSASAFSALALCLCSLHLQLTGMDIPDFRQKASYWARIGSGSACRSVYGGYNLWGKCPEIDGSSDEFAVNIDQLLHPVFKDFEDTILIVEAGRKAVSSSKGHDLLGKHPFAEKRYDIARTNTGLLLDILRSGDLHAFTALVEAEAMMLHALMMSSPEPFILMKPGTLSVIEKIRDFRNQTGTCLLFTLDAGANVHLLNPAKDSAAVQQFVRNELLGYCQNGTYFCNRVGTGPVNQ